MDSAIAIAALGLFGVLTAYFAFSLLAQFRAYKIAGKNAALESDYLRLRVEQVMDARKIEKVKISTANSITPLTSE